jgi:hypothetical protein
MERLSRGSYRPGCRLSRPRALGRREFLLPSCHTWLRRQKKKIADRPLGEATDADPSASFRAGNSIF